jgi:S-formylglutathione hydrolase FrmB
MTGLATLYQTISFIALIAFLNGCGSPRVVRDVEIHSSAVGRSIYYRSVLPNKEESEARLPAIVFLHGLGGSLDSWNWLVDDRILTDEPVVFLFVDVGNSWYLNWEDAGSGQRNQWETFLMDELLPDAISRFPIDASRVSLCGYSMGGFGALVLALRHPDKVASAASIAGALEFAAQTKAALAIGADIQIQDRERLSRVENPRIPTRGFRSDDQRTPTSRLPESLEFYNGMDPFLIVNRNRNANAPPMFIACGFTDTAINTSQRFVDLLREHNIEYESLFQDGGHDRKFLKRAMTPAIRFLLKTSRSSD